MINKSALEVSIPDCLPLLLHSQTSPWLKIRDFYTIEDIFYVLDFFEGKKEIRIFLNYYEFDRKIKTSMHVNFLETGAKKGKFYQSIHIADLNIKNRDTASILKTIRSAM